MYKPKKLFGRVTDRGRDRDRGIIYLLILPLDGSVIGSWIRSGATIKQTVTHMVVQVVVLPIMLIIPAPEYSSLYRLSCILLPRRMIVYLVN